ncbi:MAG: hypothetical protein AB9897_00085 [Anaerolineaceae bacterium]
MVEILNLPSNKILFVLPRGGTYFNEPVTLLDENSKERLAECPQRWPLENKSVINEINRSLQQKPKFSHWLACETAFFSSLSAAQQNYALPARERAQGYQRFGGDGLFHEWMARNHPAAKRLVSIHLCGDTTLAAIANGVAIDSSKGYSLLEGLPGMTTCGDLDPSIIAELVETDSVSLLEKSDLFYKRSGWQSLAPTVTFADLCLGNAAEFQLVKKMFFEGLAKSIGAMISVLGGADLIAIGCDTPEECQELFENLKNHFSFTDLEFELSAVKKDMVLSDLIMTYINQNK